MRAVFLPSGHPPMQEDDEPAKKDNGADDSGDTEEGGVSRAEPVPSRIGAANGTTYVPRKDNIDRLLEDLPAEEYANTWVARRGRQSLSAVRGRSELSIGADELNEQLAPSHLERHRHKLAPDEAFGVIFAWDTVVGNARELELRAWTTVAAECDLPPPDMDDIIRSEDMAAEAAVQRVFLWTRDWADIKRLVFRKGEVLSALHDGDYEPIATAGVREWLHLLSRYKVKCVLCAAAQPRARAERVMAALGLTDYFPRGEIVSSEDEFDTLEQMYLVAAIKAQRPPEKCVVFTDRPAGIAAAHDVSAKAVALIGAHPAYEVKTADETIRDYSELVVYNIRRLFSEAGHELMDTQTQIAKDV